MKPQYTHNMVASVFMWLDNKLANEGQAYVNVTGVLYRQPDTGIQGVVYASPYKTWVYDSCVAGAVIPTGFMNSSGQFLTRADGLVIDFINGRVISPQNWGPTLSGAYSRKEVNVYYSSAEETNYVLDQVYGMDPSLQYPITGFRGRALAAPMVMLTNAREENVPWALGGLRNSESTVRGFVIASTNWLQEGINSLCADTAQTYIPLASYGDLPITPSGDLKGATYDYCTGIYAKYGCGNGLFIDKVFVSKISDKANNSSTFYLSIIDWEIQKPRIPGI